MYSMRLRFDVCPRPYLRKIKKLTFGALASLKSENRNSLYFTRGVVGPREARCDIKDFSQADVASTQDLKST